MLASSSRMFANGFFQTTTPAGYFGQEPFRRIELLDSESGIDNLSMVSFNQLLLQDNLDDDVLTIQGPVPADWGTEVNQNTRNLAETLNKIKRDGNETSDSITTTIKETRGKVKIEINLEHVKRMPVYSNEGSRNSSKADSVKSNRGKKARGSNAS